mgnify:CR=1 FL=1
MEIKEEVMEHLEWTRRAVTEMVEHSESVHRGLNDSVNDDIMYLESSVLDLQDLAKENKDVSTQSEVKWTALSMAEGAYYRWHQFNKVLSKKQMIDKAVDTLMKKHHDYGNKPLIKFGLWGFVIRIDSKMERLKNLTQNNTGPELEGIEDTWFDIFGYAVLLLMYQYGHIK